ncbi:hypothetical protein HMPREF0208_00522 [Citrobacter koseri]|uniref:Uncharacterized protein n=1 Tax=Citrobacter koseri (strain ATCC BAA-895 / CDC 4225-83 / SGSC4696) TaxID=290338 RepID=A8AKD2_CITK8|nr:hypothetical protein CKO_02839 [Citrobacter koseri ATCC BAA-895]KWZ97818.1 hypothetical protein HMPREF3207_04397 [Citrobacter koseri]KXA01884.1 hypothetical protein HMPREF3220_01334 [Citrobacter koseri]KXB46788.1 hypothetical protein HMPREF0208_00522 [Citrobacter koseri]
MRMIVLILANYTSPAHIEKDFFAYYFPALFARKIMERLWRFNEKNLKIKWREYLNLFLCP